MADYIISGSAVSTGSFGAINIDGKVLSNVDVGTNYVYSTRYHIGSSTTGPSIRYATPAGHIGFFNNTTQFFKFYHNFDGRGILFAGGNPGFASYPTYTFDTDWNTGMSNPAHDNLGLYAGGTEYVRINSSGLEVKAGNISGSASSTGSFGMVMVGGTELGASPITALNNATANELVTVGATTTELDSESNLIWNGSVLGVGTSSPALAQGLHVKTTYINGVARFESGDASVSITLKDNVNQFNLQYDGSSDQLNFNNVSNVAYLSLSSTKVSGSASSTGSFGHVIASGDVNVTDHIQATRIGLGQTNTSNTSAVVIQDKHLEFRQSSGTDGGTGIVFSEQNLGDNSFRILHNGAGSGANNTLKFLATNFSATNPYMEIFRSGKMVINSHITGDGAFISGSSTSTGSFGHIVTNGHIIPTAAESFDLGSETKPFRDLHVSSGSIKMYAGSTEIARIQVSDDDEFEFFSTKGLSAEQKKTFTKAQIRSNATPGKFRGGNIGIASSSTGSFAKVGIGNTSSTYKLHISSSDHLTMQFDRTGQETYRLTHGTSGLFFTKPNSTGVAYGVTQDGDFHTFNASGNAMFISDASSGNVGINDTTPTAQLDITTSASGKYGLQVNNNSGNQIFAVYNSGGQDAIINIGNDGGATKIQLLADGNSYFNGGNVGIGTITPAMKLDVAGATKQQLYTAYYHSDHSTLAGYVGNANALSSEATNDLMIRAANDFHIGTNNSGTVRLTVLSGGNVGIGTTSPQDLFEVATGHGEMSHFGGLSSVGSGKYTGITFGYMEGNNSNYRKAGIVQQQFADSAARGHMLFLVETNSDNSSVTSADTKMKIHGTSGYVGIGEVSSIPSRLSVANTGTDIAVVKARSTTSDARASYQIGNDADNWYMGIDGGNSDAFFIADVVDSSDRLVITQAGNVGIGKTSPGRKLDVTGDIGASTNIVAGTALYSNELITRTGNTLTFKNAGGTAISTFMNTGNVGIGTTAPSSLLDVRAESAAYLTVRSDDSHAILQIMADNDSTHTGNFNPSIRMYTGNSTKYWQIYGNDATTEFKIDYNSINGFKMDASRNVTIPQNLTVGGTITAQQFVTEYLTETIIATSGSTKFGNTKDDDIHQFTGSINVSGSITLNGSAVTSGGGGGGSSFTVANSSNDRIITSVDSTNGNAEANLTFNGGSLVNASSGTQIKINFTDASGTANGYNYFMAASNDGGNKAVHFVNGSNRSSDNGVNTYTIRNDGGPFHLGRVNQISTLEGSRIVLKTGNVGIGTTSPESLLHIESTTDATMRIHNTTSGYAPQLLFEGKVGANADYLLGKIDATWDGASNVVSSIRFESGADTSNKDDGMITFWTSPASSTVAERMRIDQSGNVGIGTSSPSAPLHVSGDGGTGDPLATMLLESTTNHGGLVINAPTSKQKHIRFQDNGSLKWQVRMPSHMANPDSLRFFSYTANADVMTLLNDGTVGIGTTSPNGLLELYGGTPALYLYESDAGAGDRLWNIAAAGETFAMNCRNDANTSGNTFFAVERTDSSIDSIKLKTGAGVDAIHIDSSQNVGIGVTDPDVSLEIGGSMRFNGASNKIYTYHLNNANYIDAKNFQANTSSDINFQNAVGPANIVSVGNVVRLKSKGTTPLVASGSSVGIGTESPSTRLQLKAVDSTIPQFTVQHSGNTVNIVEVGQGDNGNSGGAIVLRKNNGIKSVHFDGHGKSFFNAGNVGFGTELDPDTTIHMRETDDVYLTLESQNTGLTKEVALKYQNYSTGNNFWWVGLNQSDDYSLAYGTSFSGANTRFLVTESGNVGIGTTSPGYPLVVNKTESAASDFITNLDLKRTWSGGTSTDRLHGLIFSDFNSVNAGIFVNRYSSGANYNSHLEFYTNGGSSNMTPATALGTPKMVIQHGGNVGIGTTSPGAKLEVNGGDASTSLVIRAGGSTGGIRFYDSGGTTDGYIQAGDGYIGFLDMDGHWAVRHSSNVKTEFRVNNSVIANITATGMDITGKLSATSKSFLIDHPTKENKKLQYASLEGPENGVYVRGKLEGDVIELPDYWVGLVHEDSITVNLTPIGKYQHLYVEDIKDNKVFVKCVGGDVKCFYTIYGERKDIEKLKVEF